MKSMKIRNQLISLTFISAVFLSATVNGPGQKVRYNYLQGIDFSKYKTYRWEKIQNVEYPSQLLDEQIMRSIDSQLSLKGFSRTETGTPDLLAIYQAAVNQERQWTYYDSGWGWGGWAGWGAWGGPMTSTSWTIHVGTLNLDFYDPAIKKQVWRGAATKTLDPPKDPTKLQGRIDKAMRKLLKNFPPKKK